MLIFRFPLNSLFYHFGSSVKCIHVKIEEVSRAGAVQWVKSGTTLGYDRNVTGYSRYSVTGEEGAGEFNFHISSVR